MSSGTPSRLRTNKLLSIFRRFLPFWMFLIFFKFAGALHYSLIAPLGERLLPLWLVGLLMGGTSVGLLLLDVPAGYLLDRYGYRRFLKLTTFFFLAAAVCLTFGLTRTTYLLSLLISVFGWLFFGPGVNAYILSHTPRESSGKFISMRDIFGSIGVVLASSALPFTLLLDTPHIGYALLFLFSISLAMIFLSPRDVRRTHDTASSSMKIPTHRHHVRRDFFKDTFGAIKKLNPASTMLLLTGLSGSIFYGIIWFVVPLVIAREAHTALLLGVGLGVFDFAIVALGFLLGNLADRMNKRRLVFFGLLIFSVAGMFLGFNFGWLFLLFGFLSTSGDEMADISLWSWLHSLDREHDKDGVVAGVIGFFQDLGWSIGPIIAGILYVPLGPSWTIFLGALPIFATWIFYQCIVNKEHEEHLSSVSLRRASPEVVAPGDILPIKPHRPRHRT